MFDRLKYLFVGGEASSFKHFKLVKDSFQFKRKTINNNLKKYNQDILKKVLEKHDFNLSSRAEEIDLQTFIELSEILK